VTEAETIGQRIKRERVARDMTQGGLAELVGVGQPHVSKVEADKENPSDDLLLRIGTLFGVDPVELLIVARRLPPSIMERLAADPAKSLLRLRRWTGVGV
jgi:transcriptional regulator with XRE-family HTH domain